MRDQNRISSRHASPSPAAYSSSDAAVSSISRDSVTQRPSGVGCASTSGPCRQRTPQRSSSIARIAGDETASG